MAPAPERDQRDEHAHGQGGQVQPVATRSTPLATSVSQRRAHLGHPPQHRRVGPVGHTPRLRRHEQHEHPAGEDGQDGQPELPGGPQTAGQRRRRTGGTPAPPAAPGRGLGRSHRGPAGAALGPRGATSVGGTSSGAPSGRVSCVPSRSPSPHARPSVCQPVGRHRRRARRPPPPGVERRAGRPSSGGPRRRPRRRPRVAPTGRPPRGGTTGVTFSAGCRAMSSASTTRSSAAMPGSVVNSRPTSTWPRTSAWWVSGPADVERDEAGELQPVHGVEARRGRTGGRGTRAGPRT